MKLGPYAIEQDYSHYVANASKIVLAVVGPATKGEVGVPTICTSPLDLTKKFGPVKEGYYALYAANFFLAQSSKVWFVRAANEETLKYATVYIPGDGNIGEVPEALEVTGNTAGTFYDNYVVELKVTDAVTVADRLYDFTIKNSKGTTIETAKGLKLVDISDHQFSTIKVQIISDVIVSLDAGTYTLSGGSDCADDLESADYITAGSKLLTDNVDMNLLAIPGVSDAAVITDILNMMETRKDTIYLVDPPKGLTRDEVNDWHNGTGSYSHTMFNSSYGALYYDWQVIYDSVNAKYVEVPPSVVVASTYAYSTNVSEIWFAPAGLTRGVVRGVTRPVTSPDTTDVQYLYEDTNAVNCIVEDPQAGLCVFGQKTLLRTNSALNRVNVRLLMNYLKRVIVAACKTLTFEPNDRFTWNSFEDKVEPVLKNIKTHRGIYEYKIVKGESIVTDEDIDNHRMPALIVIKPTKTAEEIPIYFNITTTGADFQDVLESAGISFETE